MAGKRIGEILIEKKLITPEQLQDALLEQKGSNEFLGAILVRRGWISDQNLTEVLSEQFGIPLVNFKDIFVDIDIELARKFSSSLVLEQKCFPLYADENFVTIAIVNPLNAEAMSRVQAEALPLKVRFVLMTSQDMGQAIGVYHQTISNNIRHLLEKKKEPPKQQ